MPEVSEQALVKNERYSVRQFSPNAWGGMIGDSLGFLWPTKADMLPRWGTVECDIALRVMHYTQHNSLWSGAAQAFIEKYLSIPYEISGGRNLTFQWQDLFFESEFGEGYDSLVSKGLVDYLTLNRGWFMEVVSYGDPSTPIKEGARILGLNHLDALRIYITGNREYPYLYQSEWGGQLHKMHYTRVLHIARQPSPNTLMFGMGKSALYDTLTVANSEIMLGRHENELLNDLPPPGIVIFNNVKADQVQDAMKQFEYERIRDGQNVYRAPLRMDSLNPSEPATVTFVPMSTVPEGFDKEKYTQIHVNLLALNLGLDPQDVWPLSGQGFGTGAQSKVLAAKTDTKGVGYLATRMTRLWNTVLPRSLEWEHKSQNSQQDRETADLARSWIETANGAQFMNNNEKRQLIANQVPAFADVLKDEDGQIRLFDADPKAPEQLTATDSTMLELGATNADEVTTNSQNESVMIDQPNSNPEMTPDAETTTLAIAKPSQPSAPAVATPAISISKPTGNVVIDDQFKKINDQLKAGLITIAQAQEKLGLPRDAIYEGMYIIDGYPTPRNVIPKLYESKFGRGVASFGAVLTGETMPTGNGAGPVPSTSATEAAAKAIRKEIDATADAFIQELAAIIQDGLDRTITKAGAGSRIRGAINRYGKAAYIDGLIVGGVPEGELDEDDRRIIGDLSVRDSQYVTNLVNEIYSEGGISGTAEARANKWLGTIDEFYYEGIASADKNGMYVFTGDDGHESCIDCKSLKGKKHRMAWWIKHKKRPGVDHDSFECKGYNCQHYLERVKR